VVARAAADVAVHHPRRGWVEQSPAEIWQSFRTSVQACLRGTDSSRLGRYRAEHQRESLLLWDRRTGQPVSP